MEQQVANLKQAYLAITWTNEDGKAKRQLLHERIHKLHLDCPDGLECSIFQADQAACMQDMRQQGQEALRQWSQQAMQNAITNTLVASNPINASTANPIFTGAIGQYQGVVLHNQQAYAGTNALQSFKPPINFAPGVAYEIPQGQLGTVTYDTETTAVTPRGWLNKLGKKITGGNP